jgi:2-methylcitrate dehydratase PrpD
MIKKLSKKVTVNVDSECINARSGCTKVTVYTVDGRELSYRVDFPKGSPQNPLTKEELERKFVDLASLALPEENVKRLLEVVNNLESLEKITLLTDLLRK